MHSLGLTTCVTLQVSDYVRSDEGFAARQVIPALGLAWSNMVTVRLLLTRKHEHSSAISSIDGALLPGQLTRAMHVVFAPHLPPSQHVFVVSSGGVELV